MSARVVLSGGGAEGVAISDSKREVLTWGKTEAVTGGEGIDEVRATEGDETEVGDETDGEEVTIDAVEAVFSIGSGEWDWDEENKRDKGRELEIDDEGEDGEGGI